MSHAVECRCEECAASGVAWTARRPQFGGSIVDTPNSPDAKAFYRLIEKLQDSKKSYERAVAKAFLRARLDTDHTFNHGAVRWNLSRAAHHLAWLDRRAQ